MRLAYLNINKISYFNWHILVLTRLNNRVFKYFRTIVSAPDAKYSNITSKFYKVMPKLLQFARVNAHIVNKVKPLISNVFVNCVYNFVEYQFLILK